MDYKFAWSELKADILRAEKELSKLYASSGGDFRLQGKLEGIMLAKDYLQRHHIHLQLLYLSGN